MTTRPQSTPPPGAYSDCDWKWYESESPQYPSSPVEQLQVSYQEVTVTRHQYPPASPHGHGPGVTTSSPSRHPNVIYNLKAFPLASPPSAVNRTVGLTAYPAAAVQYHNKKRQHSHSEQGVSLPLPPPPSHHYHPVKQLQHPHHHHPHQQHRVNREPPAKERHKRVSSPEFQMQSPPLSPHGNVVYPGHSSVYAPTERRGGHHGIQRRSSENYGRERPAASSGAWEKGGYYERHGITKQPKSDSSLQYNSVNLQPRRGVSPHPHQFPPHVSEARTFLFDETVYPNAPGGAYDPSMGNLGHREEYPQNTEEHWMSPNGRPSSAKTKRKTTPSHTPRRAMTPNPSLVHNNRGDAWYIEEEDTDSPDSPVSVTVGHMDHALLPQKLYFSASSPPPPPVPPHYQTSSSSQPTMSDSAASASDRTAPHKRHSFAEPPVAPSPSHSRSDSSEGYSSRRSSRDSGRMVASPTHHPTGSQRTSSLSSAERSSASPVPVSAYEQMLNGTASHIRKGQSLHNVQPAINGTLTSGEQQKDSPSGTTRRVISVVAQGQMVPSGRDRFVSSPQSSSPSKYTRKKHQYDYVRHPHGYEEVDFSDQERLQLSQASTKSEIKLNSKWARFSRKNESEKPSKSETEKRANMHLSDSRLNKITRRRASDKSGSMRKSPAISKRFSTGAHLMEGSEVRRRREYSDAFVKAKYRVSNPEPHSEMTSQQFYIGAVGRGDDLDLEDVGSGDNERSDSDTQPYMQKRNARSKSSGGLMIQKFSKKLSKFSLGSGGGGGGTKGGEGSGGSTKKKKGRTNSASQLEGGDGGRLTQSMEQLSPLPGDKDAVKGFSTPGTTPIMSRSRSKPKMNRRNSEPDLEGALSTLFRSGSKKNLTQDAVEALFESIEQGNEDELRQHLELSSSSDLNTTNEDDFLPVDLAAMLNHESIVRMLLEKGAKDSTKFCRDPFSRFSRITSLLMEAERQLDHIKCELIAQNMSNSSAVKDLQRRLRRWQLKENLFSKMKNNYEEANVPGPPSDVCLHVTSNRSLMVTFGEPKNKNGAMVTRYKIEWCRSDKFTPIVGDFVMTDLRSMEYTIPDLNQGEAYFVRVYAYNMKGFGPAQMASPTSAVPSSWHDVDGSKPRYEGTTDSMHRIAQQLSNQLSHFNSTSPPPNGNPTTNKTSKTVKKSISKFFGSAVKFHKTLKAGVYISSLIYSDDDKILTTVDDQIPIVEVSDSHSSNVGSDFVWLAKVACTWKHVKSMSVTTEQFVSSPAVQFRHKLLCAVLNLQAAIGIPDLGLLHPIPFKDSQGAIVFVIVNYCKEPNALQTKGSLKWSNLPRLRRKRMQPVLIPGTGAGAAGGGGAAVGGGGSNPEELEQLPVSDRIVVDAEEVIAHHKNSTSTLTRGLYLGYLKGRSSVASMRVICSREYPNVLPHHKIRDNPNISSEEWCWLKSLSSPLPPQTPETTSPNHTSSPDSSCSASSLSSLSPQSLQQALLPAIDTFLHNLGIDRVEAEYHQLYCHEAIELNEDITLLLVMPSHDQICTPPGSSDHFAKLPNFVPLPINTFEIMQLFTYQQAFMVDFSVVSARLEVEFLASQQRMREAFSNAEGAAAKKMHKELEDLQEKTELEWKQMRWIDDAVQKGRDLGMGSETLLLVKTIRDVVSKQQEQDAIRRQKEILAKIPSPQHCSTAPASGYLRVFPAYNTGLIKGTSVKLYITIMTTTSDVIRLVVHQLEKTRVERGIPGRMIMEDDLNDFYLVAITGNQELVLNEDYNPLQLQQQSQNSKCHLYVRRRSEQLRFTDQVTTV